LNKFEIKQVSAETDLSTSMGVLGEGALYILKVNIN